MPKPTAPQESVLAHPDKLLDKPGCLIPLILAILGLGGLILVEGSRSATTTSTPEPRATNTPISYTVDTGTQYAAPTTAPAIISAPTTNSDCIAYADPIMGWVTGDIDEDDPGFGSAANSGYTCVRTRSGETNSAPPAPSQQQESAPAPAYEQPTAVPPAPAFDNPPSSSNTTISSGGMPEGFSKVVHGSECWVTGPTGSTTILTPGQWFDTSVKGVTVRISC